MHIFACPNLFWSLLHRIAWKAQIATRYSPPQSISTFTIPTGCQNDQHSKPNISGWSPKNIWCGSKYKNFESSVRHTLECESILYRAPCSRSEISEKCLVQFGFFHFKFRSVSLDNFIKQKFLFSEEWQGWVVWSVSRLIFLTSVYPQRIRQFHSLNVITYQKLYCFITSFYRESMENLTVYTKYKRSQSCGWKVWKTLYHDINEF